MLKTLTLLDHLHLYASVPPKEGVTKTIDRIKGKIDELIEIHLTALTDTFRNQLDVVPKVIDILFEKISSVC